MSSDRAVIAAWIQELLESANRPDEGPGSRITDLGREVRERDRQRLEALTNLIGQADQARTALRPFAEKAAAWESRHPSTGRYPVRDSTQITHRLGDFRRARKTIEDAK